MNLLIKYPTRSRPELFLKTLKEYIDNESKTNEITYLISYDSDDVSMTESVINTAKAFSDNIIFVKGNSRTKIQACNADIENVEDWNIIVLISDDMHVQIYGWDYQIVKDMEKMFPDTNGCLWYHDGSSQRDISTLSIVGRKYYDQYGYLYHPSYKSFFCDNEYTEVAIRNGAIRFINGTIIKHQHPAWGQGIPMDTLYNHNDKYWGEDMANYNERKANGFRD